MKKSFMTRVLATGLSVAMAFSLSTATNLVTAEAAVPTLVDAATGGSGKAVTVDVDAVAKLKINPNVSKTYSVASVKKSSKKIKTAVSKNGTVVYVRGVAATGEKDSAIRVSFKAKKTGKTSKFTFAAKVKVVAKEEEKPAEVLGLKAVTQKSTTNFELTFAKEMEKVAVADFKLVRDDDKADIQIKAVAVNTTDKTKVSLDTYLSLADGKSYTLTYTDADKKETTATFTVSDGKLAAFGLTPLKVTAGVATELKYQKLDANGMVLGEVKVGSPESNVTVEYKFTNTATSYNDVDKIYLPNIGDKATVTVTKHTYTWNADGTEKDIVKGEFEVEAVASATTVDNYTFTISQREPAWEKLTSSNNKVALEDDNYKAFFKIVDSNNANVSDKYTVESADPSIIIANGNAGDGATLTPVKVGSTVLIVKDANGNSVKTANVQVVAKRVLSSVAVNRSSISVADASTATSKDEIVYVSGSDQYGDYKAIDSIDVTRNLAVENNISVDDSHNNYIVFEPGTTCLPGTYAYTVKANEKISVSVNVTVVKTAGAKAGYGFDFSLNAVDGNNVTTGNSTKFDLTTGANTSGTGTVIKATLVERKGGVNKVDASDVTISAIKVYRVGGDTYAYSGTAISRPVSSDAINGQALVGTDASITFTIKGTNKGTAYEKYLVPGTYKVQATIKKAGETYNTEDSFEIVDWQTAITASVIKTTVDTTNNLAAAMDSEDFVKLYDSKGKIKTADYDITDVDAKFDGKTAYVKSITIKLSGADYGLGTNSVIVKKIPINRTFTALNVGDWT